MMTRRRIIREWHRIGLCLIAWAILVSGCARTYEITLRNSDRLVSTTKPRLDGAYYVWTDSRGSEHRVHRFEVIEIDTK